MKSNKLLVILVLIALNVSAKKVGKMNLASLYDQKGFTEIKMQVYHVSDSVSTVYMDIQLKDFHYRHYIESDFYKAYFKVYYELYPDYDTKFPIDSASVFFSDTTGYDSEIEMIVNFDVKAVFPANYILKLRLTDLYGKEGNSVWDIVEISKTTHHSRQNFLLKDSDGYPLFTNALNAGQYFILERNEPDSTDLFIRYFHRDFPIAKPPFSSEKQETYKFEPDSFYTVSIVTGETPVLELPYKGIYHFQTDISQDDGLTLFHFSDGFPRIETPLQAIEPLRYLTTKKEYNRMLSYENKKAAVDSFWLYRASGNPVRARKMIQKYYGRVVRANRLFSSYQEGWKTDRGLIYIIYGPPSEMYRKEGEEEWIFGERGNPMSIKFYFNRAENPLTSNDFRLQRSTTYQTSWYIAVDNWRR
ncbi:MAG: GWxTD domain-containing protein [Chlorobi bacterium]|nr:GWxTD domain-containing protein [Chlorobiota bacterium]